MTNAEKKNLCDVTRVVVAGVILAIHLKGTDIFLSDVTLYMYSEIINQYISIFRLPCTI